MGPLFKHFWCDSYLYFTKNEKLNQLAISIDNILRERADAQDIAYDINWNMLKLRCETCDFKIVLLLTVE